MLTVSPIKNVQSTINNISFKAGVRVNSGADVVNDTPDYNKEGGFLTDFLGTIRSTVFYEKFMERQKSIEEGLKEESQLTRFDAIA